MIDIDWGSLVKVAGVSLAFGVGLVVVFSVGLLGVSMAENHVRSAAGPGGRPESGSTKALGTGLAGVCFLACAAAVLFGIWLIVPQFH